MSDFINIVIADDHPLFRAGVADALRADGSLRIVGEAGDGVAALQLIEKHAPRVAVVDIEMPKLNGLDLAQAVRDRGLETAMVLLTFHDDAATLRRALAAGVRGYVLKDSAVVDIATCVHYVASGKSYLSPAMSHHVLDGRGTASAPKAAQAGAGWLDSLTPAERRVMVLVASGGTTPGIAAELGVSPKTVENHRANICAKLDLHGPNALVRFAVAQRDELSKVR